MYKSQRDWARAGFLNSIRSAFFSSDRTIKEYAKEIWLANNIYFIFLGKLSLLLFQLKVRNRIFSKKNRNDEKCNVMNYN